MLSSFTLQIPMKVASSATVTATHELSRRARASAVVAGASSEPGGLSGSISMKSVEWVGGAVEQIGAHADARGDERLRRGEAVQVLAGAEIERQVAADEPGYPRVGDRRPGAASILTRLIGDVDERVPARRRLPGEREIADRGAIARAVVSLVLRPADVRVQRECRRELPVGDEPDVARHAVRPELVRPRRRSDAHDRRHLERSDL